MHTSVSLELAERITDLAVAHARELGEVVPLTVAVLDAGGHLVLLRREDGSSFMKPDIAFAKAWGSLGMQRSSRAIQERAVEDPTYVAALAVLSQGRLLPVPGGVRILEDGIAIGAIGISGAPSDVDEECAIVAIRAVGLTPDPEHPQPR